MIVRMCNYRQPEIELEACHGVVIKNTNPSADGIAGCHQLENVTGTV